jgi:hypothetical protein
MPDNGGSMYKIPIMKVMVIVEGIPKVLAGIVGGVRGRGDSSSPNSVIDQGELLRIVYKQ